MDHLLRSLAPVGDQAWAAIEVEARRTLEHFLTARRLVDVVGPTGWSTDAVPTGRVGEPTEAPPAPASDLIRPAAGVGPLEVAPRQVVPLVELRVPFTVDRRELEAAERGAPDPDLDPVVAAAQHLALGEDGLVFGSAGAPVGLAAGTVHDPITIGESYNDYPRLVAQAVAVLQRAGVGGPYGVALGPRCHTGVIETTERGGYPVLEHLHLITGGPVVWAPAVDGAVVLSLRGGDLELTIGQDASIGYLGHDRDGVTLYLEESVAFRVLEPRAAVLLRYP